ncbi:MAG: hypothetical protein LBN10_06390 [Propionibacteriaceae bacterium]|nr:hypothetical protein [Propionibacteriaceae bacterium]
MTVSIQDRQMTTIKVSRSVRDALKEQADGSTLNEFLAKLLEQEERRRFFARLKEQMASTPQDLREDYRQESDEWERASLTDLQDEPW